MAKGFNDESNPFDIRLGRRLLRNIETREKEMRLEPIIGSETTSCAFSGCEGEPEERG